MAMTTPTELPQVRLGEKTILRPGDLIRVDSTRARYTVQALVRAASGIEVHAYGGKVGYLKFRVFRLDQVIRCRSKRDDNDGNRLALHEVSEASKRRKTRR